MEHLLTVKDDSGNIISQKRYLRKDDALARMNARLSDYRFNCRNDAIKRKCVLINETSSHAICQMHGVVFLSVKSANHEKLNQANSHMRFFRNLQK